MNCLVANVYVKIVTWNSMEFFRHVSFWTTKNRKRKRKPAHHLILVLMKMGFEGNVRIYIQLVCLHSSPSFPFSIAAWQCVIRITRLELIRFNWIYTMKLNTKIHKQMGYSYLGFFLFQMKFLKCLASCHRVTFAESAQLNVTVSLKPNKNLK